MLKISPGSDTGQERCSSPKIVLRYDRNKKTDTHAILCKRYTGKFLLGYREADYIIIPAIATGFNS